MDTLIKNYLYMTIYVLSISVCSANSNIENSISASVLAIEMNYPSLKEEIYVNNDDYSLQVANPFDALPSSIAIHWGDPIGQRVKVITSLYCVFCAKQQEVLKELKNIHFEEYLLPQLSNSGQIDFKSAAVWCNADRLVALNNALNDSLIPVFDECNAQTLHAVTQFVKEYQLHATPIFIRGDGRIHIGYLSKYKLKKWLKENEHE
jgi:hypothetical protein